MEFRGPHQEITKNSTTPYHLGYSNHLSIDVGGGGGERKRNVGNDNNGTTTTTTQTLDPQIHNVHQLQHLNLDHQLTQSAPISVSGAVISPISVRSGPKTPPARSSTRYRECLKNHAASIGGNVVDGCGEFMPSGENGTLEALTCAACNCHRNFHRKEIDGGDTHQQFRRSMVVHPLHLPQPLPHHQKYGGATINAPPVAVAYGGGGGGTSGGTESSSEDLNHNNNNHGYEHQANHVAVGEMVATPTPGYGMSSSSSKKRFRTRFTQEQKERMMEFAEKVGWRIQKQYEGELEKLCDEVGVKRQVLKVWMHNNKNSSFKKQLEHDGHEQLHPS